MTDLQLRLQQIDRKSKEGQTMLNKIMVVEFMYNFTHGMPESELLEIMERLLETGSFYHALMEPYMKYTFATGAEETFGRWLAICESADHSWNQ